MGQGDWTLLDGTLDSVRRGVTAGVVTPNGGGNYCFGMHSTENAKGVVAFMCNQTNFGPMQKGGRITGALKRSALGSPTGFAPFLFIAAENNNVSTSAYLLGLSNSNGSHIELRKGSISDGLPDADVVPRSPPHVLMRSTDLVPVETWQHLRVDYIRQGNNDVLLQVFRNDLSRNLVTAPVWELIPGMEGPFHPEFGGYVDDALGVNTASDPLLGETYLGFGTHFETTNRAAYFDHITIDRQL